MLHWILQVLESLQDTGQPDPTGNHRLYVDLSARYILQRVPEFIRVVAKHKLHRHHLVDGKYRLNAINSQAYTDNNQF